VLLFVLPSGGLQDFLLVLLDVLSMRCLDKVVFVFVLTLVSVDGLLGNLLFGNLLFGNLLFGKLPFGNLPFGNLLFGNLLFGNLPFGNLLFGNLVVPRNTATKQK